MTVGGTNPGDYVLTNGCTTAVAPAGTCTLTVVFRPTAAGTRTATVSVTSNGGTGAVALTGTATAPAPSAWNPVVGDASKFQTNLAYSAALGTSSLAGGVLSVPFVATGPADLARPEGTCLQRVDAGTVVATILPASTTLTSNVAGSFGGTFTFPVSVNGSYVLKYACRADYNAARVGTLSVPAVTGFTGVVGNSSTFALNAAYTARVTSSNVANGSWLAVGFSATGPADLARPEATCVKVTQPGGAVVTRAPAAMVLSTAIAGAYAGTAYYETLPAGTYAMTYACRADYSAAPIGSLSGVVTTVPGAPVIGTATATGPTATANWSPPASDGGSPITGYAVTATSATGEVFGSGALAATARTFSFASLPAGTWTFVVRATNAVGTSPASAVSNAVSVVTFPGAPVIGTATVAGPTSATVTWTPPANTGNTAITGYLVSARNGVGTTVATATAAGTATSLTVTGLVTGVPVSFVVTAVNVIGAGAPSAASNVVTPGASAPGAPVIGTATASGPTATANWLPPVSDGGSPVTGYTVQARNPVTGETFGSLVQPSTARSLSYPSLPAGQWTFTVRAINVVGTSAASAVSNAVTVVTFPGSPTNVQLTALGSGFAVVAWTAPANTGGTAITSYVVSLQNALGQQVASAVVPGTSLSVALPGLPVGSSVRAVVTAVNAVGGSPSSAPSAFVTVT